MLEAASLAILAMGALAFLACLIIMLLWRL